MPIVDAHQHYFDIEAHYYPWLNDRPLRPFRYGDYSSICRNFLPQDYRRLTGRHRVVQTVVIEGEWDPATPADEVSFIESLAQTEPTLAAMVGAGLAGSRGRIDPLAPVRRSPAGTRRTPQTYGHQP